MYPDREKVLARGRRKGKTFIRVFCGIFILLGISLFTTGIAIGVSGHTFRQKAEATDAVILAMRGANSESLGTPVVEYAVYNPQNHRFGFSKRSVHFPGWEFKTKRPNFKKTQMPFKCFLSSV